MKSESEKFTDLKSGKSASDKGGNRGLTTIQQSIAKESPNER